MIPYSRPKFSDLYTVSQRKLLENYTLFSCTYLYSLPYMAVPPAPPPSPRVFCRNWHKKNCRATYYLLSKLRYLQKINCLVHGYAVQIQETELTTKIYKNIFSSKKTVTRNYKKVSFSSCWKGTRDYNNLNWLSPFTLCRLWAPAQC